MGEGQQGSGSASGRLSGKGARDGAHIFPASLSHPGHCRAPGWLTAAAHYLAPTCSCFFPFPSSVP